MFYNTLQIDPNTSNVFDTINGMVNGFLTILPNLVIGAIVFVLFYFIAIGIRSLVMRLTKERNSANVGKVLGRLAQWLILLFGVMLAVTIIAPSIKPVDVIGALGIGSVAIGFAFKDILQNLLAGILLLLRQPFQVGDQIVSGDFEGTVESIETRSTIIKTYDGRQVVIPNGDIYTRAMIVNTAYDSRRSQYDIGIGYGDDLRKAADVILDAVKKIDGVLDDPVPDVLTMELASSTVNLRARWWTHPTRKSVMAIRHEVISACKEALDKAGIDMPFDTQVMLWHDQTEETDGDRTQQREGWPSGEKPPKPWKMVEKSSGESRGVS